VLYNKWVIATSYKRTYKIRRFVTDETGRSQQLTNRGEREVQMNKWRFWLAVLVLGVLVAFSVGATAAPPELKVQKALGVTGGSDVHKIPLGSTITHLPDESTTILGPDGNSVISVKNSEVGLIPTPNGMFKATRVYTVPSGSFVHGTSQNTIEIYDADGKLILTVIERREKTDLEAVQTMTVPYTGWVEFAYYGDLGSDPDTSFTHFYAEWTIPAAPINSWMDDDVVGLFNGIQGSGANEWDDEEVILQPVVAFNENGFWVPGNPLNGRVHMTLDASHVVRSDVIAIAVGDVIAGEMNLVDPDQPVWQASISNQDTGESETLTTDLLGTDSQFITVTLEGINLEADNNDLFGTTYFENINVRDEDGELIFPNWHEYIDPVAEDYFTGLDVRVFAFSRVKLRTDRVPPSGGGCPFLQVWEGSNYVDEGLLNIHDAGGVDVTYQHTLTTVPEPVDGAYAFRLVEHPMTISDIDQVQLHAILEDGTIEELPLISAQHSDGGDVCKMLLNRDDWRVEEKGADHNGGKSQSIGLKFAALGPDAKALAFVFTTEGSNPYSKTPW